MILKELYTVGGAAILVDDADFAALSKYSWTISCVSDKKYVVRGTSHNGRKKAILMHREIMNPPAGMSVDHIDGNGLNNQRSNLELAPIGKVRAHWKVRKDRSDSSLYLGVRWDAERSVWVAFLKDQELGTFRLELDAAIAYDDAAKLAHVAEVNFPEERHAKKRT